MIIWFQIWMKNFAFLFESVSVCRVHIQLFTSTASNFINCLCYLVSDSGVLANYIKVPEGWDAILKLVSLNKLVTFLIRGLSYVEVIQVLGEQASVNFKVVYSVHSVYQHTQFVIPTKCTFLISTNIKWAPTHFSTCVQSSGRTQCHFLWTKCYCKAVIHRFCGP